MKTIHVHWWKTIKNYVIGTYKKNNWPSTHVVAIEGALESCRCNKYRLVPFGEGLKTVEVVYGKKR